MGADLLVQILYVLKARPVDANLLEEILTDLDASKEYNRADKKVPDKCRVRTIRNVMGEHHHYLEQMLIV